MLAGDVTGRRSRGLRRVNPIPGGRQFDVYIDGTKELDHLDIFAEVGFMTPDRPP